MDNGDGTYSYRLESEDIPSTLVEQHGVTWKFIGPARFAYVPELQDGSPVFVEGGHTQETAREKLIGSQYVDAMGRVWEAVGVDEEAVCKSIHEYARAEVAYNGASAEEVGLGLACDIDEMNPDEASESGWWAPRTWHDDEYPNPCGDGIPITVDRWDSDDRSVKVTQQDYTLRQRKQVAIFREVPDDVNLGYDILHCSGVMISAHTVLTAAHCLTDIFSNELDPNGLLVCTYGNYVVESECSSAFSVRVGPNWDALNPHPSDDYGTLMLQQPLGDNPIGWMSLSSASDNVIEANKSHHAGYPGVVPGGGCNRYYFGFGGPGAERARLTATSAPVINATVATVRTRLDVADGHSGGGIWYCQNGCSAGKKEYLASVLSGYFTPLGPNWTGGPKVSNSSIRSWIIVNTF